MEYLEGGRENQIARAGNTVIRPSGLWTPTVHSLLNHLRENNFLAAPEALGFDKAGNEIVSFIEGEVNNYPLSEAAKSLEALQTAASLLRAYHDATISFLNRGMTQQKWMLPAQEPAEVICHGDYAPYNVVLNGRIAIAIIDFDTTHPGPRVWDIAYALYRWAPLTNPQNLDGWGDLNQQITRAQQFCDSYGLAISERENLVAITVARLHALVNFMHTEAKKGNEAFQQNITDGHHLSYLADIEYLQKYHEQIRQGLTSSNLNRVYRK